MSPAFLDAFCKTVSMRRIKYVSKSTHVHGVLAGRDLASVTLGKCPEEGVGEGVLAEVGKDLIFDLKRGELSCQTSESVM